MQEAGRGKTGQRLNLAVAPGEPDAALAAVVGPQVHAEGAVQAGVGQTVVGVRAARSQGWGHLVGWGGKTDELTVDV